MAEVRPHSSMVATPPAQPCASPSLHSRRPPAKRSVSLLHSSRSRLVPIKDRNSDSSSDSAAANRSRTSDGSPSSLQPLGRGSSGESSNAETWFEKSNNEVNGNGVSFADNDPPFFMRNSSSSETPPDAQHALRQLHAARDDSNSLPVHTGLLHLGTDGSSNEDFRSVIDDLTIENKKLKRRLKKYEKLHDAHLRDEKLFEVRIHGLPPDRKRELEETLRKFASGAGSGFPSNGYAGLIPALEKHNTTSSQTSQYNADSAYASLSASGQGSSARSAGETADKRARPTIAREQNTHSNIHTYLHQIPEGLVPQTNPANMSERAKKKLVVRRLEQIFTGKASALHGHQQSLQQQDVSQMAARADRVVNEAQGQRTGQEGTREAHIMLGQVEDPADPTSGKQTGDDTPSVVEDILQETSNASSAAKSATRTDLHGTHDQRPTRPLDLDPHRAQIPEDNMRYFRHLGFSPPDPDSRSSPEDGHGWIYLNLLINMAQLHTINVTDDFVRKALNDYSSKFEQSKDGRKVRWKGGRSTTRTSSSGGGSSRRTEIEPSDRESPRKRPKLSHRESGMSRARSGAASGRRSHAGGKLTYTPLFFHKDSTDEAENSSEEDDDSLSCSFPAPGAGDSSGMTSSAMRTTTTKKLKKRDDGPIIFYNNARFCTDLSGERNSTGNSNAPPYVTVTEEAVGKSQKERSEVAYEKRGPLASVSDLPEPMDIGDNPIPASMELAFPPQSPLSSDREQDGKPFEMEVTGIGGVWPADHFAITVLSRHARVDPNDAPSVDQELVSKKILDRFAPPAQDASRKTRATVRRQILGTETKLLPSSDLPPALSFMPFSEESQDDDDGSEVGDEMSFPPESPGALPPSTAPQPVEFHYTSSDEEDDDDDDYDDNEGSDGSLDLLAAAREVDPDAIRAREREYDANMAERLAEEIPAGSSAATAGGGSGFTSPASDSGRGTQAVKVPRATGLMKAATKDSRMMRKGHESSSPDEDDGENDESRDRDSQ